ncbi:DUF2267 domain-containing protein [Actinomycetospora sp. OC33-EN08]|uniref:Putative pterin-4-alpha-carbinolamine dehydratase n=1 Tax=Actinomycetospora aurantiaca TaxID=3129233 RepID=A0ABU8MS94_9PSEU
MRHQEFLSGVATRAGLERTDDAREGTTATLATLAEVLPADDRDALAGALPTLLTHEAGLDAEPGRGEPGALVETVARRTGWSPERARYVLSAVVEQLAAEDPDLGGRVAGVLPDDLRPTGGPALPPDAADAGSEGRPQPVDADAVARALTRLTDWSGDVTGIERTIELPSERLDLVLARVRDVEHELAHRTRVVARTPGSVTLRARTESMQVVTELDIALAERVDDVVAAVGSGG